MYFFLSFDYMLEQTIELTGWEDKKHQPRSNISKKSELSLNTDDIKKIMKKLNLEIQFYEIIHILYGNAELADEKRNLIKNNFQTKTFEEISV
jgi:hypothetical protein